MKLDNIKLVNFKSFANKTVIPFKDGINCIVGPNGSGKSNILDAVRWLLGVQNAKDLRGSDMSDLIFNGSASRKNANFAEVSITFTEVPNHLATKWGSFSEITLTRKVFNSGDREYYINNQACRLKDIRTIFTDTGINEKGYSIIEQGKVERIINADPMQIRHFIEETAGVSKFKENKKDALKKLDDANVNRQTILSMVTDLERQLASLQKQIDNLNRNRELSKQIVDKDKLIFAYYLNNAQTSLKEIDEEYTKTKSEFDKTLEEYNSVTNLDNQTLQQIQQIRNDNKELTVQKETLIEKINELNITLTQIENNIEFTKKSNEQAEILIKEAEETLKNLQQDKIETEETLTKLSQEKTEIEEELHKIQDPNQPTIDSQLAQFDTLIAEAQAKLQKTQSEISQTQNNKFMLEAELKSYENSRLRLEKEFQSLKVEFDETINRKNKKQQELEELNATLATLTHRKNEIKSIIDEIEENYNKYEQQRTNINQEINLQRGELNSLKQQIEADDNLKIMQLLHQEFNAIPLAQYVSQYKLHFQLTNYDDQTKDFVVNQLLNDVMLIEDKFETRLAEMISDYNCDLNFVLKSKVLQFIGKLNNINLNHKIENVYTIEGTGLNIVRKKSHSVDMVLLEKISTLELSVRELIEKKNDVIDLIDADSDKKENLLIELDDIDSQVSTSQSQYIKLSHEVSSIDEYVVKQQKNISVVEREMAVVDKSLESYKIDIDELQAELTTLETNKTELTTDITANQQNKESMREAYYRNQQNITELASKISIIENSVRLSNDKLSAINSNIEINERKINELKSNRQASVETILAGLEKELELIRITLEERNIKRLELIRDIEQNENKINELESSELSNKMRLTQINDLLRKLESRLYNCDKERAVLQESVSNLRMQYYDKYGLELEELEGRGIGINVDKVRSDIRDLEAERESLGAINMVAEADYNTKKEEYDFYTKQLNDIDNAINDIHKIISELDELSTSMFIETFETVKVNFANVFGELFGGGIAELSLLDENDKLNSGVLINVQPPGKKLQSMHLMSGGEKTMTALSLLFALFLVKATPFCFLDEIDAPLDAANVARFGSMVRRLAGKTQFIIITHNNKTMSIADNLYGVTMQEAGVSSLVAVSLEHA